MDGGSSAAPESTVLDSCRNVVETQNKDTVVQRSAYSLEPHKSTLQNQ